MKKPSAKDLRQFSFRSTPCSIFGFSSQNRDLTSLRSFYLFCLPQGRYRKCESRYATLPQLLQAASAAQSAFEEIKNVIAQKGEGSASKGRIVLATVKGDVHDIGKNIVKVILENYGFEVIDLGRDVPVETVVDTVREKDVHLVGLSALMTTTLKSMEETIAALHAAKLDCKIMVGGAVLTPEYAEKIGADWYAKDAKRSADIAKEFFGV